MKQYNHKNIESNWRDHWFSDNIYEAVDFSLKPKKYILTEFPYPSGPELHAGHMMRYTVPEVYSRYLRMKGYNVLFPMGWDCFGLPAETFALKEHTTPQKIIAKTKVAFKKAMQEMGYGIDWSREIDTSDPEYYKWTQWIFLKLWEAGLAEKKDMPVWWCDELGVLADEEVLTNSKGEKVSERGGYKVVRKNYNQWNLKITAYADKLLQGLNETDYTESVKLGQINWIGKKEGTEVLFKTTTNDEIKIFTTRIDTIFGATFIAIAPEHPITQQLLNNATNAPEIQTYVQKASAMSELERKQKQKTGVCLQGVFAYNPVNNVQIPIFVADYIMMDFGTGAIMGVPAHDERDFEFAKNYSLEIIKVIKPTNDITNNTDQAYEGEGTLINSGEFNELTSQQAQQKILQHLSAKNIANKKVNYKLRDQIFSRQRYWGEPIPLKYTNDNKIEKETNLPLVLPEITQIEPEKGVSPLQKVTEWVNTTDSNGNNAVRETDTMPTWAGSNWYYIRYTDPHNKNEFAEMEKMKYWLPVDKYFGDAGHTTAHLMYTRFWFKFLYDNKLVPVSEPFKFRMSGGMLLGEDQKKMSKSRPDYAVVPKELIENYGADSARMVLCFLGPYSETYPWNSNAIGACYRVLEQIYNLQNKVTNVPNIDKTTLAIFHNYLKAVTQMMEDMKVNTVVSEIMKLTNHFKTLQSIDTQMYKDFIKTLAPIAPFVAEELWQTTNNFEKWEKQNSVHLQQWPQYDNQFLQKEVIQLPVQINGKMRGTIEINAQSTEQQIVQQVYSTTKFNQQLNEAMVKKVIYVEGKIINFIV